jgi:predicted ferric reductase
VSRINPTLRGFAIIVLIAVVITLLNLENAVNSLLLIARIAFFLAIAFFLFLLWRERREEISMWGVRSRVVFYAAVVLAVVNMGANILTEYPHGGLEVLIFIAVFVACGYSLWRTWRSAHTYGY